MTVGLVVGGTRNQVHLPRYARLDLRADQQFTYRGRRLTLFVEVLNALNRANYGRANRVGRSGHRPGERIHREASQPAVLRGGAHPVLSLSGRDTGVSSRQKKRRTVSY